MNPAACLALLNAEMQAHVFMTTDAVGGVWTYSLALAKGLAAIRCVVTLAVLGPPPSAAQIADADGIPGLRLRQTDLPLEWLAEDEQAVLLAAAELDELAVRLGVDLAHLHTPALAAFSWRMPVVAVAHSCVGTWWEAVRGGAPPADFVWRMSLMDRGLRKAITIAPSESFAAALRRVYGGHLMLHVIHNGVPPATALIAERGGRVLAAGRLWDDAKNLALLDDAAGIGGLQIDAAGPLSGANGRALHATHLTTLGELPQFGLRDLFRRAAIFAAPSRYEPFGLAVLEAAQTGAPLVLADIPTFRELWQDAAIFLPLGDPQVWAEALRALLNAPARCEVLGAKALTRSRRYDGTHMVAETAALHRSVRDRPTVPCLVSPA